MSHKKWSIKVVNSLPLFVIREPERVFIAGASFLLGISAFVSAIAIDIAMKIPNWLMWQWGFIFTLGGIAKIVGLYRSSKAAAPGKAQSTATALDGIALERAGAALIALGSFTYMLMLIYVAGINGYVSQIIFGMLCIANILRLVISSAGMSVLEAVREEENEND
jgi:hypothetical protein